MILHNDYPSPWGQKPEKPSVRPESTDGRNRDGNGAGPGNQKHNDGSFSGQRHNSGNTTRPRPKISAQDGDLIAALSERLRRFGGGQGGGNSGQPGLPFPSRRGFALIAIIFAGLWLSSGLYRVAEGEQAAIMRFGEFIEVKGPGLRYHWPTPIESAIVARVSVVNRIESGDRSSGRDDSEDVHMLTGDENLVALSNYTVHWHIQDLGKFLFQARSAESIIRAAADSALREIVAKTPIDMVVAEARERINQDAQKLLQKLLDTYDVGVAINEFILQRADPPDAVMDAFRDVQRAKADQERARNEALAYRNEILPKARGQAKQMILEAEAYHKSMIAKAEGEAGRFNAVLAEYRKAPEVTRSRMAIETMEQVVAKTPKVLVDPSVANVVPYLPLPMLNKTASAATQTSGSEVNP